MVILRLTASLLAVNWFMYMAEYEKRVRDVLSEYGCTFRRHGKGDHDVWYSPITNKPITVDHKIKSRHTANGILKRAGIDSRF